MPRPSLPRTLSRKRASLAKSVGAFVPGLTRKSFEKYGFSTAAILTDWQDIAGKDLAAFTLPERLKWPKQVDAYADTDAAARGRPGATLVLRVDGPRAIEVQYQTSQIMERINAHFGYRAVSEIRFIQAPLPEPKPNPAANTARRRVRATNTGAEMPSPPLAEDRLDAALARLERSVQNATQQRR